jgi:hypothetical protein
MVEVNKLEDILKNINKNKIKYLSSFLDEGPSASH